MLVSYSPLALLRLVQLWLDRVCATLDRLAHLDASLRHLSTTEAVQLLNAVAVPARGHLSC